MLDYLFTDDLNIVRLTCLHSVLVTNSTFSEIGRRKIHLKFKSFERIPSGGMPVQVMAKCMSVSINDVMV